ncbi:putative ribonuclease H-like domain-containing protein [Tanacetum coccineum]
MNVEDTSSKAMVAFDGAGFDWSFMADEEVPTNLALMAFQTRSGIVPISTARQRSSKAAAPLSAARPINTAAPKLFVNSVNTTKGKRVSSAVGKQGINVVKSSACWGDPQVALKDTRIFDSGCSRHMTGNKSYLLDYQDYDGGFVAFAGSSKGGRITGKGKIKTGKLDFEDVYFVKKLNFNLFSVSHMCDKKNNVLFTETKCLILSPDLKLPDENQVMLKIHRKDNMYSFDLKNVVPSKGLTCLIAKATNDESNMWNRRLGHINFKTMNKLVKGNLVRGLPSKIFENDHSCVACLKGKQHKASWIKREFSNARTLQQNGVAERKNRTLIEAARTMMLVTKPHNKTPYELLIGRTPIISFMRPFGCPVTILNTLDHLGKFDGKADEGFLVGYSINSKAFRVFNSRTRKVEENLHVNFLENKPNVTGSGPEWLFDIDTLTNSLNYHPVNAGNKTNGNTGLETNFDAGQAGKENVPDQEYILLPLMHTSSNVPSNYEKDESSPKDDAGKKNEVKDSAKEGDINGPGEATNTDSTNRLNTVSSPVNTVEAMQEELLQFKLLNVWTLVDLPHGKKVIGTKWVFRNKRDQRGILVRNKARLVAQGYRQEEGVEYDEVFAPVARIEAIRLFLSFASFMGFTVYQMDVKSAFLYGTIKEEVYVNQPPGFMDLEFPNRVYKVEKALYGLHQAPRVWYETLSTYLLENEFRRATIDKTLFIKKIKNDILLVQVYVEQRKDGIFLSQDKYVYDILKKFGFSSVKTSTPMETHKPLSQDTAGTDVDDSPMDLIAYSDSDYDGASIDRKSTTRGCQFLGYRLILWQCKKQIIVANSTTEAEYIAASN